MHNYTPEELEFIRLHISHMAWSELTVKFNETFNTSLSSKALSGTGKRNGIKSGRTGFFPKGHTPFNKGVKGAGGWEPMQFKKGNKPHNWVPLGSERITKDGYIQVKVDEGKFQHNWRGKHILVWEEHNGPLPNGHVVIFGDGDNRNFEPANLLLISRKQLVRLNQLNLIGDNAELTKTGVIIADICNRIGERKHATRRKENINA